MGARFFQTALEGVRICEPAVFADPRGCFVELFRHDRYAAQGIDAHFVQDNYSHSHGSVLRGLHYQYPRGQAKLVSCLHGAIFDVAVDIRRGSPTFGKWVGTALSDENRRQIFIPEGFAHGFCVLSEEADVMYKCTAFYEPTDDRGLLWSDPAIAIDWPIRTPVLSGKDAALPSLADIPERDLPDYRLHTRSECRNDLA